MRSLEVRKTYVYHESTRETPFLSIPLMYCSRRTMLQSQQSRRVVLSEQICDSSMGQGGKAIVERPVAAGRLQDTIGLSNERSETITTNVLFCLFHLTLDEEQLQAQVSTGGTRFARDTYPSPVEYHLSTPCHLNKCSESICKQLRRHSAPSITIFILSTRPWTTPKVCAAVIRASSWVNRSNLWSMASISPSPNNFFANFSVER